MEKLLLRLESNYWALFLFIHIFYFVSRFIAFSSIMFLPLDWVAGFIEWVGILLLALFSLHKFVLFTKKQATASDFVGLGVLAMFSLVIFLMLSVATTPGGI